MILCKFSAKLILNTSNHSFEIIVLYRQTTIIITNLYMCFRNLKLILARILHGVFVNCFVYSDLIIPLPDTQLPFLQYGYSLVRKIWVISKRRRRPPFGSGSSNGGE